MVFTSGWASGINAYAVVVLLGVLGRFADVDAVPAALQRTDILTVAGVLFVVELVVGAGVVLLLLRRIRRTRRRWRARRRGGPPQPV
jgi:threonine/homoserine/homoserine lactone efflux protein